MIEFIKTSDNWGDIKNTCRTTVGKKPLEYWGVDSDWKLKLLLAEHSPIRMLNITWQWTGLKSWISVHFTRHKIGIEHFVESQRDDRTGEDRDGKRQDALVNHRCIANAQAIINISRKRLCRKSHIETQAEWYHFLEALRGIEPELFDVCVKECVYRNGICPEIKSCGYCDTFDFERELRDYRNLFEKYSEVK
jgi:hypothetical protein